jgi:hypothetical protein
MTDKDGGIIKSSGFLIQYYNPDPVARIINL